MPGEAIIRVGKSAKLNTKANAVVREEEPTDRILSSGKLMLEGIKPIVNDVFEQLKKQLLQKNLKVFPSTIMVVVREAMELVETTALKGIQQKELVNELLLRLVEEATHLVETQRELCLELVNTGIINETIELVVDATKGKLNVNLRDVTKETANCCFAFLKRSQK